MGFKPTSMAIAVGIGLLIWFVIPVPEGVAPNAWHLLALFVATIAAIIGVPMALALFALTFIVCFIPVVGAIIAGTVATSLALITHGWVAALIMAGGTVAVMWLESHLLQPLLLGKAASLHPLAVLIGIAVGAQVGGIVGALVVIPTMAFFVAFIRSLRGQPVQSSTRKRKQ